MTQLDSIYFKDSDILPSQIIKRKISMASFQKTLFLIYPPKLWDAIIGILTTDLEGTQTA